MSHVAMNENEEAQPRPTPFRAMLWKEWRESWWILLLTILVPPLLVWASRDGRWQGAVPVVLLMFPATLGARLFASDAARGTAIFQDERPVARSEMFSVRLLLPCVTLAASILLTTVAVIASRWSATADAGISAWLIVVAALVCFASSLLCSVLLDRPATALAAGGVMTVAVFLLSAFAIVLLHKALSKFMDVDRFAQDAHAFTLVYSIVLSVLGIVLLLLGRWAFIRQGRT